MAYRSARSRRVTRSRPSPRRRTPTRYERAIRSAHRPAWPWSPAARAAGGGWPWIILATLLAAGTVVVIVGFSVRAHGHTCPSANDRIIWAEQVTAEEGDQSSPPPGMVDQADRLASCGGGHLAVIRSAGQGGVQVGPVVSLSVERAPGQPENDPTARRIAVEHKVDAAFQKAHNTPVPGAGRDVTGMLGAIAAELGNGHNHVWIHTLGLPTVPPADARILLAADPAQAAASIARFVPSLRGADVHLILARPAGAQPQLNTVTDAWRRAFMIDLLRQAGAHVGSVQEVEAIERPAPGAPPAPVVPNLPENTRRSQRSPSRAGRTSCGWTRRRSSCPTPRNSLSETHRSSPSFSRSSGPGEPACTPGSSSSATPRNSGPLTLRCCSAASALPKSPACSSGAASAMSAPRASATPSRSPPLTPKTQPTGP